MKMTVSKLVSKRIIAFVCSATHIARTDLDCRISSNCHVAALERRTSRVGYGRNHLAVATDIIRRSWS